VALGEHLGDAVGELARLVERGPARHWDEDVDAVRAARLHVPADAELVEELVDEVGNAHAQTELPVRRVEVEEHEVGSLGLVDPRVPGVHVDAVHLHHPEERELVVHEREVDEPRLALSRPGAEPLRRDPVRLALGRVLLEEEAARGPLPEPLHRERPVLQVRDERGRDGGVVVPEVALRHAVLGEEHAVGAREAHLAAAATGDPLRGRVHDCSMPADGRRRGTRDGATKPA
jgi:hypothetical protein